MKFQTLCTLKHPIIFQTYYESPKGWVICHLWFWHFWGEYYITNDISYPFETMKNKENVATPIMKKRGAFALFPGRNCRIYNLPLKIRIGSKGANVYYNLYILLYLKRLYLSKKTTQNRI